MYTPQHGERRQVDCPHHVAAQALRKAGERIGREPDHQKQQPDHAIEDCCQDQGRFASLLLPRQVVSIRHL